MIIAPRPEAFPFYMSRDFDGRAESLHNPHALEQHLLSREGVRFNGPPVEGTQHYRWEGRDRGHLYIHVGENSVHVDTHAHWDEVLNLYEFLRQVEPHLLIVDNQTARLYDALSYRSFVAESYARKRTSE
jgi:hypothetical protein